MEREAGSPCYESLQKRMETRTLKSRDQIYSVASLGGSTSRIRNVSTLSLRCSDLVSRFYHLIITLIRIGWCWSGTQGCDWCSKGLRALCWGTQVLPERFSFHLSGTLQMINLSEGLDLDAVGGCVKGQTAAWCGLIDSAEAYSFYGSFTAEFRSTDTMKVGLKWCRKKERSITVCISVM